MATSITPTGVIFHDGTTQSTRYDPSIEKGRPTNIISYGTAGTYTWTKPAGCTTVKVQVVGGGGGSSGYGESGGAGGFSERWIDVSSVSSVTVTVGGGGAASSYAAAAGDGGTSSFGTYCSATGGYGANRNFGHCGGFGGVGSGGSINLYGGMGSAHYNLDHGASALGGSSYFGGGAGVIRPVASGKADVGTPGAGAPGARGASTGPGGAGESGLVVVWEYT